MIISLLFIAAATSLNVSPPRAGIGVTFALSITLFAALAAKLSPNFNAFPNHPSLWAFSPILTFPSAK